MVLFIGDKPSPRMKPGAKAFQGADCELRLRLWIAYLGLKTEEYELFNSATDSQDIQAWFASFSVGLDNVVFIALGNVASNYLTKNKIDHFKMPHPSGRNRQINDKEFIAKKLEECRIFIKDRI